MTFGLLSLLLLLTIASTGGTPDARGQEFEGTPGTGVIGFTQWGFNGSRIGLVEQHRPNQIHYVVERKGRQVGRPMPFDGPAFLPGGRELVYAGYSNGGRRHELFTAGLDGGSTRRMSGTVGASHPVVSEGGLLAFARSRSGFSLKGVPHAFQSSAVWVLDLQTGKQVQITPWRRYVSLVPTSFSPDGTVLTVTMSTEGTERVLMLNPGDGSTVSTVGDASEAAISPDGSLIAFVRADGMGIRRIVVATHDGDVLRTLQAGGRGSVSAPSWDSHGEKIAFIEVERSTPRHRALISLVEASADGSCQATAASWRYSQLPLGLSPISGPVWQPSNATTSSSVDACS